jgi:hypothetical protein
VIPELFGNFKKVGTVDALERLLLFDRGIKIRDKRLQKVVKDKNEE